MKKIISIGLTALFFVFLFGTVLMSCGPIFDVGNNVNGNGSGNPNPPPPPPPPASGFQNVEAFDARDLAEFLESEETSYSISLEKIETKDIYLIKNISIVKPMRIIGTSGKGYTIHSVNREGGNTYYCLDLQADLELQYCGFTG